MKLLTKLLILLLITANSYAITPFIGEIKVFSGNFAPRSWAFCEGQLLPISQHSALFSILGTTYGGDGRTTFALPDLRGRTVMQHGQGPTGYTYRLGQKGGSERGWLENPNHLHTMDVLQILDIGNNNTEVNGKKVLLSANVASNTVRDYVMRSEYQENANADGIPSMQPSLGIRYIIALEGIYPSRS